MSKLPSREVERRKALVEAAMLQNLVDKLLPSFEELEAYHEFIRGENQLVAYRGTASDASEEVVTALRINAMSNAYPRFMNTVCVIYTRDGREEVHVVPKYRPLCTSELRYSVYELIDPKRGLRFYIGQTCQSPILRYQDHLFGRLPSTRGVAFRLAKQGIRIGFKIVDGTNSSNKIDALERHYIQLSRRQGLPMVNRTC